MRIVSMKMSHRSMGSGIFKSSTSLTVDSTMTENGRSDRILVFIFQKPGPLSMFSFTVNVTILCALIHGVGVCL